MEIGNGPNAADLNAYWKNHHGGTWPIDPDTGQPITRYEAYSRQLTNAILDETYGATVQHDVVFDDYGATLHVNGTVDGLEHLRFDCFENEPHYHYVRNADGGNLICRIDEVAVGDPLSSPLRASKASSPRCCGTPVRPTSPRRSRSPESVRRWPRSARSWSRPRNPYPAEAAQPSRRIRAGRLRRVAAMAIATATSAATTTASTRRPSTPAGIETSSTTASDSANRP